MSSIQVRGGSKGPPLPANVLTHWITGRKPRAMELVTIGHTSEGYSA